MRNLVFTFALATALTACQEYTPYEDLTDVIANDEKVDVWQQAIGGTSDPRQNWIAGRSVQIDVITPDVAMVSVYSIDGNTRTLYAYSEVNGNQSFVVPVMTDSTEVMAVECQMNGMTTVRTVGLTNEARQQAVVDFTQSDTRADNQWQSVTADSCNNLATWTLGFENMDDSEDYDFNDVVLSVTPDPKNHTAKLTLLAVGSKLMTEVHYDGPNGDVNLGEAHMIMGSSVGNVINGNAQAVYPAQTLAPVEWPANYSMMQDAHGQTDASRFYIKVYEDGKAPRRIDITTTTETTDGTEAPAVISVCSNSWQWAREGVSITFAYPAFAQWAQDATTNTDWWTAPQSTRVVNRL